MHQKADCRIRIAQTRRQFLAAGLGAIPALAPLSLSQLIGRPLEQSRRLPDDFFGMHINNMASDPLWHPHTTFADLGQKWIRLWDTYTSWKLINRSPGVFDWHRLDEIVGIAKKRNMRTVFNLASAPDWATGLSTGPSQISPGVPTDTSWENWVEAVTSRYGDSIDAYELWNEPNLPKYWAGSVDDLVHKCSLSHKIIRQNASHSKIITPCVTERKGLLYFDEMVKRRILDICDIASIHTYVSFPEQVLSLVKDFRYSTDRGRKNIAIWATECGWSRFQREDGTVVGALEREVMSNTQAVSYIARYALCAAASGLTRSFFYTLDGEPVMKIPMINPTTGHLLPAGSTHRRMARLLAGSEIDGVALDNNVFSLRGKSTNGRAFIALWCEDWKKYTIKSHNMNPRWIFDAFGKVIHRRNTIDISMVPTIVVE